MYHSPRSTPRAAAERQRLPRALVGAPPGRRAQATRPGAHSRSALTTLAEALAPPRPGRDAVVGGHVALEHAEHGGLAVAVLGPDRLGGRVGALAAHERQAAAEVDALGLERHAAQRRDHPRASASR